MKKALVIHPFLFAIYPILFLFSHNIRQLSLVSSSEILVLSAIVVGLTLLLLLLTGLIIKNKKKVGIVVSIFLVLFFSYGYIFDAVYGWHLGCWMVGGMHRYSMFNWIILFTCSMLFTCGTYIIIKTHKDLYNLTKILNITALSLVLISLINIGIYKFKTRGIQEDNSIRTEDRRSNTLKNTAALRDIYYIILDAYASSSTLKKFYNYDNSEFLDYLTNKGFYVASKSRSNYMQTFLSLASSLNMEYINYLADNVGIDSKDLTLPYQMVQNSRVINFLKSKGYKFIHFNSGWGATDYNKYADYNFQCSRWSRINEFTITLFQSTILSPFKGFEAEMREKVLCTFSKIAEVNRIIGPKFVFAHIVVPHPPYIFNADGEPAPKIKLTKTGDHWLQKKYYLNQLIFVNKKVKTLVNEIISSSKVLPIIILQADHGPASIFLLRKLLGNFPQTEDNFIEEKDGLKSDHLLPTKKNMLRERIRIFNAYYLPPDGNELLSDTITPVNTFRLIFNYYFNTNYELLDNQSYYSTYKHPYKLINVTDKVSYD